MPILKRRADKIALLARQREIIYHTQDLMVLWGVYNKNTLYTTIKRLVQKGDIFRIYKGMYAILPVSKINPWLIGLSALHGFGYVSAETILSKMGAINQLSSIITLIGNKSLKFKIANHNYVCRKLNNKFLHRPLDLMEVDGVRQASAERAAADMLFFNPKFHFDNKKLLNLTKVKELQKEIYDLA